MTLCWDCIPPWSLQHGCAVLGVRCPILGNTIALMMFDHEYWFSVFIIIIIIHVSRTDQVPARFVQVQSTVSKQAYQRQFCTTGMQLSVLAEQLRHTVSV